MAKRFARTGLGGLLKDLRLRRGLSLKEVQALSAQWAGHLGGGVSHPYLSQLEQGREFIVTAPKLLTLAAIYAVPVDELIGAAPTRYRNRLADGLRRWRAAGRPEPRPLRYLPRTVSQVDAQIEKVLAATDRGSLITFSDQETVRRTIRTILLMALVPPFVSKSEWATLIGDFWPVAHAWRIVPQKLAPAAHVQPAGWHAFVVEFVGWLIYEKRLASEVLALLDGWRIITPDVRGIGEQPVSCTLRDPALNRAYGIPAKRALPACVVYGARWRQLARCFWLQYVEQTQDTELLPSPPQPSDAAADYLAFCRLGCSPDPAMLADARITGLHNAVHVLSQSLQRMRDPKSTRDVTAAHVAEFLASADALGLEPGE